MVKFDSFDEEHVADYEAQLKAGQVLLFRSVPGGVDGAQRWFDAANLAENYCIGICKGMGMQGWVVVMQRGSKTPDLEFQDLKPKLEGMVSKLAPPPGPPKRYGDRH